MPVALISVTFKVVADMSPVQINFLQLRDMNVYIMKEKCLSENLRKLKYFWRNIIKASSRKRERKGRNKMTILTLSAGVQRGLEVMLREGAGELLKRLSDAGKLTCSVEEGMRFVGEVSVKSARSAAMQKVRGGKKEVKEGRRPRMILPFCGKVEEGWCKGVRLNHGLHTQCANTPIGDGRYCTTCQRGASSSASGKPAYGDIEDRCAAGADYRDSKGKRTDRYANVAKKLGLDIEEAKAAAKELGWVIPAEELVELERKRGRPPKAGGIKKKPLKVKKKKTDLPDQITQLLAEHAADEILGGAEESKSNDDEAAKAKEEAELKAAAAAAAKAKEEAELEEEEEEEEEEDDEDGVTLDDDMKVDIEGVCYFKTEYGGVENVLFSYPDGELVGALNEEGEIVDLEEDEEE